MKDSARGASRRGTHKASAAPRGQRAAAVEASIQSELGSDAGGPDARSSFARKPRGRAQVGASSESRSKKGLLSDGELRDIESSHDAGITAVEIVDIFTSRGIRLSEATFRKYVQQGLLPRSRRIGRKGKHRGSLGVYPAKTVRRVNTIKQLMNEGYTIEEIQEHFLRFADLVEGIEENLAELFDSMGEVVKGPRFDARAQKTLTRELTEAKAMADELMVRIGELADTVAEPPTDRYRGPGAAGSAEELL